MCDGSATELSPYMLPQLGLGFRVRVGVRSFFRVAGTC